MTEKKCTFSVGIGCRIFLIILMTVGMGMISLNYIPIYYEPLEFFETSNSILDQCLQHPLIWRSLDVEVLGAIMLNG